MTTLARNANRVYENDGLPHYPVIANDIIYEGAAAGDNGSGYVRPLVAGDPFRGFADQKADNTNGSAGDKTVRLRQKGFIQLAISGLAITDVGKAVYASDDDTFTLTQGSNTLIGYVTRFVSSGIGIVEYQAQRGAVAELTDNSGGTAADTIAAIGGTYSQSEVRNAIASLTSKVNSLLRRQGH